MCNKIVENNNLINKGVCKVPFLLGFKLVGRLKIKIGLALY